MPWNLFRHKQSQGSLPLASWNQSAFPWEGNPGHNYDQWSWPYPAQTNQYTYFNAWTGNQLPSFRAYVPVLFDPKQQVNSPWITSTNKQQQNALQSAASGQGPLTWGQQQSADYISSLGQLWQNMGNGSGKKRGR